MSSELGGIELFIGEKTKSNETKYLLIFLEIDYKINGYLFATHINLG